MNQPQELHVQLVFRSATDETLPEEFLSETIDRVVESASSAEVDVSVRIERVSGELSTRQFG